MKKTLLSFVILSVHTNTFACTTCNKELQQAIYNSTFYPTLLSMLSAFIALGLVVFMIAVISTRQANHLTDSKTGNQNYHPAPLTTAAIVLGIGIGGFIDGIVFHQILQWHEMISNKLPPTNLVAKSVNMFWDGIFHAFCLSIVVTGIFLLHKAGKNDKAAKSGRLLNGGMLIGWALFNLIEGILDHQVLKLHNVRETTDNVEMWNLYFLAASGVILITGIMLIKSHYKKNVVSS